MVTACVGARLEGTLGKVFQVEGARSTALVVDGEVELCELKVADAVEEGAPGDVRGKSAAMLEP